MGWDWGHGMGGDEWRLTRKQRRWIKSVHLEDQPSPAGAPCGGGWDEIHARKAEEDARRSEELWDLIRKPRLCRFCGNVLPSRNVESGVCVQRHCQAALKREQRASNRLTKRAPARQVG